MAEHASEVSVSARKLGEIALSDFCPRCFWVSLRRHELPFQIPLPEIFSAVDSYTKNVIHSHFDRNRRLPPWYPNLGNVADYFPSEALHWSRFQVRDPATQVTLRGTPDDIFRLADGSLQIVDYKMARATERQDELFPLYRVQLNAYAYVATRLRLGPVSGLSLIYMEPDTRIGREEMETLMSDSRFALRFSAARRGVNLEAEVAIPALLLRFRELAKSSQAPNGRANCENCRLLAGLLGTALQGGIAPDKAT